VFPELPVIAALQLNNGTGGIKICFSKYLKNKCMLKSYQQTLVGDISSVFFFISIEIMLFKRGQTKLCETSTHLQNRTVLKKDIKIIHCAIKYIQLL